MSWFKWDEVKPKPGDKVIFACDDGCCTFAALITEADENGKICVLDAEDATDLNEVTSSTLEGSIWTCLPDDYPISFMEIIPDDDR